MPGIFIFDFDLTITSEHTHNILATAIHQHELQASDLEGGWQLIKNVNPTASADEWRQLFIDLIQQGHYVAIASFNEFKPLVARYLKEKINLSDDILNKIAIESWLPKKAFFADKNTHIKNILQHFNAVTREENVFLIDDSEFNCLAVRHYGWKAIFVESRGMDTKYIEYIKELAKGLE